MRARPKERERGGGERKEKKKRKEEKRREKNQGRKRGRRHRRPVLAAYLCRVVDVEQPPVARELCRPAGRQRRRDAHVRHDDNSCRRRRPRVRPLRRESERKRQAAAAAPDSCGNGGGAGGAASARKHMRPQKERRRERREEEERKKAHAMEASSLSLSFPLHTFCRSPPLPPLQPPLRRSPAAGAQQRPFRGHCCARPLSRRAAGERHRENEACGPRPSVFFSLSLSCLALCVLLLLLSPGVAGGTKPENMWRYGCLTSGCAAPCARGKGGRGGSVRRGRGRWQQ